MGVGDDELAITQSPLYVFLGREGATTLLGFSLVVGSTKPSRRLGPVLFRPPGGVPSEPAGEAEPDESCLVLTSESMDSRCSRCCFCRSTMNRCSGSLSSVSSTPRFTSCSMSCRCFSPEYNCSVGRGGPWHETLARRSESRLPQLAPFCTIALASSSLTSLYEKRASA